MKRFVQATWSLLFIFYFSSSCNSYYFPAKAVYVNYSISDSLAKDSSLIFLMQPYRDSVTKSMKDIVGFAQSNMQLKQPWGSINNFFADAILLAANKKFNKKIDAAVLNIGGIRLSQLQKGNITKGDVFELMPFENMLVLIKVNGNELQQLLNISAIQGGWPVAGLTMQIKEGKAVNVLVNGRSLNSKETYIIATSDYLANGGEGAMMLKTLPKQDAGYLVRDAVFDYINAIGKTVIANEEKRVTHVN